jgi:hypothetical protein
VPSKRKSPQIGSARHEQEVSRRKGKQKRFLKNWTNDAGISMKIKDRRGKVATESGNLYENKDS